jgi:hypothetical protein
MIKVVTTMNAAGWNQTGARMAESFRKHWPQDVELILYAEGFDIPKHFWITVRRLPAWLDEFKARHKDSRKANGQLPSRYDFRFDAVKFSHKIAAVTDAGLSQNEGVMIWMDADTFTHSPVTHEWLNGLFPEPSYIAWLDRVGHYPECGFVMYRCGHKAHRPAMEALRSYYTTDGVFTLRVSRQTHDCVVLQQLIEDMAKAGEIEQPVSLSGDPTWSHPFVAGPLGACMDHMKGERKKRGRSSTYDTRKPRSEPYWQGKTA